MKEFSVCKFKPDGSYEYAQRFVEDNEAVKSAYRIIASGDATEGFISRVIITDSGDCINWEWEFGKGVTYPPELAGREVDWSKIE